jgi:menaquinone-dependent protoporphyrinogen IX oxidase
MKVLVTFFSQTGNTEPIARAIYEEASSSASILLKKIEDISVISLNENDLIFIGSPCHTGTLSAQEYRTTDASNARAVLPNSFMNILKNPNIMLMMNGTAW